jgi:dephospho-CoA kinase
MRVALTGGFGSGKSTVDALLRRKGARVIDADAIVHDLFRKDRAVRAALSRRFGRGVFDGKGQVDRRRLGALVFRDRAARLALERIVHPAVRRVIKKEMKASRARVTVADIPLLFESGWKEKFDAVVVVAASVTKRIHRLTVRGFSAAEARRRMRAQLPMARKVRAADYVINNNGTRKQTTKQIDQLWERLMTHEGVLRGKNGLATGK